MPDSKFGRDRVESVPGIGLLRSHGDAVPSDGAAGYSPGCIFQKIDGSANTCFYVNQGTLASCNFEPLGSGVAVSANFITIQDALELLNGENNVEAALEDLARERAGLDTIAATGACTEYQFKRGCILATCAAATDITLPTTGVPLGSQCTFIKTAGSTNELKLSATALIGAGTTSNEATGADAIGDSYTVTCIANDSYVLTAKNIA